MDVTRRRIDLAGRPVRLRQDHGAEILAGLHDADGATIEIGNARTPFDPARDIGMVFQQALLLKWRTVLDNVLLPAEIVGAADEGVAARGRAICSIWSGLPL